MFLFLSYSPRVCRRRIFSFFRFFYLVRDLLGEESFCKKKHLRRRKNRIFILELHRGFFTLFFVNWLLHWRHFDLIFITFGLYFRLRNERLVEIMLLSFSSTSIYTSFFCCSSKSPFKKNSLSRLCVWEGF